MAARDYYERLGIPRTADEKEIRKAYRNLARQYHPDVCKEEGAEERFKEINEAYATLSDPAKRAQYDRMGHETFTHASKGSYAGGGFEGGFSSDFAGFGDIFDAFFGGARGYQARGPQRGGDLLMRLQIPLEDAVAGAERDVEVWHTEPCTTCDGTGSDTKKVVTCSQCGGTGQIRQATQSIFGQMVRMSTCPRCGGRGRVPEKPCRTCAGAGTHRVKRKVSIRIPPGIEHGMRLRVEGYGEAGEYGAANGDLYIEIRVLPHKGFTRQGDNLESAVEISPAQAALGSTVEVKTIDGRAVDLKVPAGIQHNTALRIPGEGVKRRGRPGDLLVRVRLVVPRHLSDEERELYGRILDLEGKARPNEEKKSSGILSDIADFLGGKKE
ncbi:MAG: molecular chaperone DnaJ [Methanospirillum sp.]|nr:molecular chaperone DnaJ [Methanospirillum sp.]